MGNLFKRGARPAMTWLGLILVPIALTPDVDVNKFRALLLFLAFLYVFRGAIDKGGVRELIEAWRARSE
jgi:hypothetical protein